MTVPKRAIQHLFFTSQRPFHSQFSLITKSPSSQPHGIKLPPQKPVVLSLIDLSLWRENRKILEGLNFTLIQGEHWVLLGQNGSGKSSLMSVLQGRLWPQQGEVSVLGSKFGEDDITEIRRHIGWVGNEIEPEFPRWQTVLDIVQSGCVGTIGLQFDKPTAAMRISAQACLRKVGLGGMGPRLCGHLSQGQTRLLTIARALMTQPKLLILDEPCTGLDPVARELFLKRISALMKLKNGPSVIYVTHHVEEIRSEISHALLLREGRILAAGKLSETLTSANLTATFNYSTQLIQTNGRYQLKVD